METCERFAYSWKYSLHSFNFFTSLISASKLEASLSQHALLVFHAHSRRLPQFWLARGISTKATVIRSDCQDLWRAEEGEKIGKIEGERLDMLMLMLFRNHQILQGNDAAERKLCCLCGENWRTEKRTKDNAIVMVHQRFWDTSKCKCNKLLLDASALNWFSYSFLKLNCNHHVFLIWISE